jgi:hypothetical protein
MGETHISTPMREIPILKKIDIESHINPEFHVPRSVWVNYIDTIYWRNRSLNVEALRRENEYAILFLKVHLLIHPPTFRSAETVDTWLCKTTLEDKRDNQSLWRTSHRNKTDYSFVLLLKTEKPIEVSPGVTDHCVGCWTLPPCIAFLYVCKSLQAYMYIWSVHSACSSGVRGAS